MTETKTPIYTPKPCPSHKPKKIDWLKWYYWAEQKIKQGAKQIQCPKCGRWYFKEEF